MPVIHEPSKGRGWKACRSSYHSAATVCNACHVPSNAANAFLIRGVTTLSRIVNLSPYDTCLGQAERIGRVTIQVVPPDDQRRRRLHDHAATSCLLGKLAPLRHMGSEVGFSRPLDGSVQWSMFVQRLNLSEPPRGYGVLSAFLKWEPGTVCSLQSDHSFFFDVLSRCANTKSAFRQTPGCLLRRNLRLSDLLCQPA